ncbi:Sterile alpha motif domain-containing protein [Quillaja saponaria]|uniref:Sterile alpha motif domain-containing protein n=1 Tax=Quillaja saponaria TaxID=32244 RepID=A0AAD7P6C4_QUISA|nr:Sterile alpha motif domain-containing protein [Quillaja saponaria]
MSESSRPRVTITLGRSGQVVKRDGSAADVSLSDSLPSAGTKRSVRDRIGNNADRSLWHGSPSNNNKRRRGDVSIQSLSSSGMDDVRIGKDDLRLKLMRKTATRQGENGNDRKNMDLREKLSKASCPSVTSIDSRQRLPESKDRSILARIPPARSADDLTRMESIRSSYSPWTLDHIRRRSPDGYPSSSRGVFHQRNVEELHRRYPSASRGLSPQRNVEEMPRRPLNRTSDSVRSVPYMSKNVLVPSRPLGTPSASFMSQSTISTLPPVTARPVPPLIGQLPPPSSIAQKSSCTNDEQQSHHTVDSLLHALGLGKYAILFKAEEVDMMALKQMGENDLKELGIPMQGVRGIKMSMCIHAQRLHVLLVILGPRKKILLAVLPRPKRQP